MAVAGRVLWIKVCPSVLLSESFPGIGSLVFSETQHGVRGPCVAVRDRARFFLIFFLSQKCTQNFFFGFTEKFSHYFFLNLVYKESSYYLLYSCSNPILGKNPVLEIWAKMLLANQIVGFLNWLYILQNVKIKKTDFFACWYRLMEIKSWLQNIGVDMVNNGCGHSGLRTLKLTLSQKGTTGINWFLVCS